MYIFHQHFKQVAKVMQGFMQQHLMPYGIEKCGYCRFDVSAARIMMIPTDYNWHCIFWEKNLDMHFHHRIQPGLHLINSQHDVLHHYRHYRKTCLKTEDAFLKYDWVKPVEMGFELLTFVSHQPVSTKLMPHLHWVRCKLAQAQTALLTRYPDMWFEMRTMLDQPPVPSLLEQAAPALALQLSHLGAVLTSAEYRLLEHLVEHRHDGILALQSQCHRHYIQATLREIKRKLGNASMSNHQLFALLFQPRTQLTPLVSGRLQ
ncbi:MAG: hypothetical protein ISP86_03260 [Shewanellaceae bacterium]|nr:hypothetical protein [Shewanellaceae bacterium]